MKTFVDGTIWTERDDRGVERIGFRQSYIEQVLSECFHVVQADTRTARKGCPLMVLETNDGTSRVRSPVTGTILTFSDKARNFPDRLTEDDVIVEVLPEGVTLPSTAKKAKTSAENVRIDLTPFFQQAERRNWFVENPAPAPQAPDPVDVGIVDAQERIAQQRVQEVQARNALAANRRGAWRPR